MPLPEMIRVKLSSESAGYMALTPVLAKEMPLRELVEVMLGVTGKERERIHELLLRGTLVSGGSRFRWAGWDADLDALDSLLSTFPDSDPQRPFSHARAIHAVLRGPAPSVEISRETGSSRRFLRSRSFWDALIEAAATSSPRYLAYSYKHQADCYRVELPPEAVQALRRNASTLRYSSLEAQVRAGSFHAIEFYVARET